MREIRWGIIGCGHIAHHFAKDLALVDGHVLHACASRSLQKSNAFAEEYAASKSYGSYDAICADDEIDIIYLATPHNSHLEYGHLVLAHSKNLLCEKPLAVNTSQVEELITAAKKNRVFLMEALWSRFNPSIERALEMIQNGEIGDVTYVNADFTFYRAFDAQHRLFNPDLAGGALLDIGVYPLFLSYLILGQPKEIVARAIKHDNGIDLQTSVILRYEHASAILNFGFLNTTKMEARIGGSKGSIQLKDRWHETQGYSTFIDHKETDYSLPTKGKGYTYEIEECGHCIRAGQLQSSKWSHQDSAALIGMCDEIRKQIGLIYHFE